MTSRPKLAETVSSSCSQGYKPQSLTFGALALFLLGDVLKAQEEAQPEAREEAQQVLEEVTVTGSRLRRSGMSTPTPVTVVGSDEMSTMAPTLLMDAVKQLPQFRDNNTSSSGSIYSAGGTNSVNLRGLGTSRTLTLLNGRRMIAGQQAGTVDISMIPTALIDRVEVVTGGASAAYGSDAISGVANFILNTNYEGLKGSVEMGQTSRGDHDNRQVEIAAGSQIGENGHLVASFDYYTVDGVVGLHERGWGQHGWAMINEPGRTPQRFYAKNVSSTTVTAGGIIPAGPLAGTHFIDGEALTLPMGEVHGSVMTGGFGSNTSLANDWNELAPSEARRSLFAYYTHELDDEREIFVRALRGDHSVNTSSGPVGFVPAWSTEIFVDNPYLPESVRERMVDLDLESVPFNRVYEEFAPRRRVEDDMTSIILGFEGDVANDLFLNASYQWGKNVEYFDYNPNYEVPRTDRFYRALDSAINPATGQIACRANIPAFGGLRPEEEAQVSRFVEQLGRVRSADPLSNSQCIPFNPFGADISDAVVDYIAGGGNYHRLELKQDIVDVTLQTTLGENRQSGAISLGGGFSYRRQSMRQTVGGTERDPRFLPDFGVFSSFVEPSDQIPIRGMPAFVRNRGIFYIGNPNRMQGEFDVEELYVESIVPIIGDADLHLAARHATYSGSGGVWASKAGLDWQATESVRFRGTWSQDTRAGSMSERFDSQTSGAVIDTGEDPQLPNHAPYTAELTTGGNPQIAPELAQTTTIGMVYQPTWAENLSMSIDLYDIKIQDAIDQLGSQEILDRCYIQGAQDACALITRRDNPENPIIQEINDVFVNVAETLTRGMDIEINYARPINIVGGDNESIDFRFFASYLDEVSFNFEGVDPVNESGSMEYPEWLATGSFSYNRGPFSLTWMTRFRDSTIRNILWEEGIDIENNTVAGRTYTNLTLSYDFPMDDTNLQAYFFVGNLFDKDPPLVPSTVSGRSGVSSYTNSGNFDVLGRKYTFGVQMGL